MRWCQTPSSYSTIGLPQAVYRDLTADPRISTSVPPNLQITPTACLRLWTIFKMWDPKVNVWSSVILSSMTSFCASRISPEGKVSLAFTLGLFHCLAKWMKSNSSPISILVILKVAQSEHFFSSGLDGNIYIINKTWWCSSTAFDQLINWCGLNQKQYQWNRWTLQNSRRLWLYWSVAHIHQHAGPSFTGKLLSLINRWPWKLNVPHYVN